MLRLMLYKLNFDKSKIVMCSICGEGAEDSTKYKEALSSIEGCWQEICFSKIAERGICTHDLWFISTMLITNLIFFCLTQRWYENSKEISRIVWPCWACVILMIILCYPHKHFRKIKRTSRPTKPSRVWPRWAQAWFGLFAGSSLVDSIIGQALTELNRGLNCLINVTALNFMMKFILCVR